MKYKKGSPEREGLEGEWPPEVLDLLAAIDACDEQIRKLCLRITERDTMLDRRDAEIARLREALHDIAEGRWNAGVPGKGISFHQYAKRALTPEAAARREWVVCDDDNNVLFRGHDVAALVEKARAMGVKSPFVKHVPEADDEA